MKKILTLILFLVLLSQCNISKNNFYKKSDFNKIEIAYNHIKKLESDTSIFVICDSVINGNYFDLGKGKFNDQSSNFYLSKNCEFRKKLNNHNIDGNKVMFISEVVDNFLLIEIVNIRTDIHESYKSNKQKKFPPDFVYPFHRYFLKNPYKTYLFEFKEDNSFELFEETTFFCP